MLKSLIAGVIGFVFAIAVMFISNPSYFTGTLPPMPEGAYRVYNVRPAFDNSGNAVFWVTASKLKQRYMRDLNSVMDIDTDEIKLYAVARSRVINPGAFEKVPSPVAGNKIEMLAGTAMIAAR